MTKEELMRKAIELSKENVANGGGPFGAVIATKEGEIIATGVNRVTSSCDPCSCREVSAIRAAAAKLGDIQPQRIRNLYFMRTLPDVVWVPSIRLMTGQKCIMGTTRPDAKNIGFDDSFIYDELALKPADRKLPRKYYCTTKPLQPLKPGCPKKTK